MAILTLFVVLLWSVSTVFCLYIALLSISAFARKSRRLQHHTPLSSFLILVPAHNEALVISQCLESLLRIDYPRSLRQLVVVADNCTDHTARIAREKGAIVYERHDSARRAKGYAINWGLACASAAKAVYDAVVVIDADSSVSANMLRALNDRLLDSESVIQVRHTARNWDQNWLTRLAEIRFLLLNHVFPMGRSGLGLSADLTGNGMCLRREVLEGVPWNAYCRADDVEYGRELLLHDIKVEYAAEAEVFAQTPSTTKAARTQRVGCEFGRLHVFRKYFFPLLRKPTWPKLGAIADLLLPSFSTFVSVGVVGMALSGAMALGFKLPIFVSLFQMWVALAAAASAVAVASVVLARRPMRLCFALLYLPIYVAWKNGILLRALFDAHRGEWIRTERSPSSSETVL